MNPRVCILRVAGSNRDGDAACCFIDLGVSVDILHLNDLLNGKKNLGDYHGLVIPGGFAYGDYVRAGAILAKKMSSVLARDLDRFVSEGKPILGICNGFQVLVEAGLLPGDSKNGGTIAALAGNESGKFECRWIKLRKNPKTRCVLTSEAEEILCLPVAHGEGRFISSGDINEEQIVLQYVTSSGELALGEYPENPNGSSCDIAGICSHSGLVFGLMPHPEDAYFGYQIPNWTQKRQLRRYGDGYGIFKSMAGYIQKNF